MHGETAVRLWPLNLDPLDFVEGDGVAGTIIELGRLRAFVGGHGLRVFQRAPGFEIDGDPRGPERMAVDPPLEAHRGRAMLDHTIGVDAVHGVVGEEGVAKVLMCYRL